MMSAEIWRAVSMPVLISLDAAVRLSFFTVRAPHRRRRPPSSVLAGILGSHEYFNRVGGTMPAFIRAVFRDVVGQSRPAPTQLIARFRIANRTNHPTTLERRTGLHLEATFAAGEPSLAEFDLPRPGCRRGDWLSRSPWPKRLEAN